MKFIICTALLCTLTMVLRAQHKELTLTGALRSASGQSFPYKLVFTDSLGIIKGYSITYKEPDDAKTLINGKLDRANRKLTFRETEIVYSHGYHINTFMCLVKASLEYSGNGRGNTLNGPIASKEADNTPCAAGTVVFADEEEIKKLFVRQEQFDTVISMKRRVRTEGPATAVAVATPPQETATEKITEGTDKSYQWYSDTIVIDLWDGGNTDGDRVTVLFNGKPYLTQYALIKERKQVRIPIYGNEVNTLTIVADNEGSDPPNTASVMLYDGTIKHSLIAYNAKGDKAIIRIRRAK